MILRQSPHANIMCENCHGSGARSSERPADPYHRPPQRTLHQVPFPPSLPGQRRWAIRGINPATHYPEAECVMCHYPQQPKTGGKAMIDGVIFCKKALLIAGGLVVPIPLWSCFDPERLLADKDDREKVRWGSWWTPTSAWGAASVSRPANWRTRSPMTPRSPEPGSSAMFSPVMDSRYRFTKGGAGWLYR